MEVGRNRPRSIITATRAEDLRFLAHCATPRAVQNPTPVRDVWCHDNIAQCNAGAVAKPETANVAVCKKLLLMGTVVIMLMRNWGFAWGASPAPPPGPPTPLLCRSASGCCGCGVCRAFTTGSRQPVMRRSYATTLRVSCVCVGRFTL